MKNTKNKVKFRKRKILAFSIIIAIVIFLIIELANFAKHPTNTILVESGTIRGEEHGVGILLREETLLQSGTQDGEIISIKIDGQRVAKEENVYKYYNSNEENVKKQIEELEFEIEKEISSDTSAYISEIKLLENQIRNIINNLIGTKEIQTINEYINELNELTSKKVKYLSDLSPEGSNIRNLITKKEELENSLNNSSEYIKANTSGIVSYRIDGLEEELRVDDFSYITKKYLDSINIKLDKKIIVTNTKCKVVNNFEGYIASNLLSDRSKDAKINEKVKIVLPSLKEVNATIVSIKVEDDESRTIVFKITNDLEELVKYRKISFDVIWWEYKGWKIPNKSIHFEDGENYVYRNRAGYVDKILIKVLRQNDEYSIVEKFSTEELKEKGYTTEEIGEMPKLSLYDEVII